MAYLAVKGHTLSHEISTYVHLAYHLHPDIVISHTGYNDLAYGIQNPLNFKKLGLFYPWKYKLWAHRLYYKKDVFGRVGPSIDEEGSGVIVDAFLQNLAKYRGIVEGNGGRLLMGIQGYDKTRIHDEHYYIPLQIWTDKLYQDLVEKISGREGFIDFTTNPDLRYGDIVYTSPASSEVTAHVYADRILAGSRILESVDE